jgi:hypothetical protein
MNSLIAVAQDQSCRKASQYDALVATSDNETIVMRVPALARSKRRLYYSRC